MFPALLVPLLLAGPADSADLAFRLQVAGASGTEHYRLVLPDTAVGDRLSIALPAGPTPRVILGIQVAAVGEGLTVETTLDRFVAVSTCEVATTRTLQEAHELEPDTMHLQAFGVEGFDLNTWFFLATASNPKDRDRAVRDFFSRTAAVGAPLLVR